MTATRIVVERKATNPTPAQHDSRLGTRSTAAKSLMMMAFFFLSFGTADDLARLAGLAAAAGASAERPEAAAAAVVVVAERFILAVLVGLFLSLLLYCLLLKK